MSEGSMHLKRPGKLRFDYGKDSPLLLVSDGKILTFVDNDVKQVTRWPIKDTPLGILVAGKVDLNKDLKITRMIRGGGLLRVTVKDPKHADQGFITLIFNAAPLDLRAWEVTDQQGLLTRVTLMNPEKNLALNDNLFTFKDPRVLPFTGNRRR
jgi:outer membrane lipoprotein-sorting protein